ncbi:MAG: alkaline phosphatase [Prolixibacteraceae bacterium]|nr:alkaline phosphatase [Prolixibacteraceae bacterium]
MIQIAKYLLLVIIISFSNFLPAQEEYKTVNINKAIYNGGLIEHEVKYVEEPSSSTRPRNVIFLIGDGMGVSHAFAGLVANHGELYLKNFKNIGFITTHSHDNFVTDSGAGGTALACGEKTYNHAIGVNKDTVSVENIREKAEKKGMATGVVSSSAITHATPASFVAHQPDRGFYEAIASDFLKTGIDVLIGGGLEHFTKRKDSTDLTITLKEKGYKVLTNIDDIAKVKKGKLAGFTAPMHNPSILEGRGNMLQVATKTAIHILDNDKDGFFLMVEGSEIDWGGHQNFTAYIATEVLDLDQTIGIALEFAAKNKETLVVVTADHETGGFAIEGGDYQTGTVNGDFTSTNHTGVMVPVYAFGPGSEKFRGFHDNTDIPKIIGELIGVEF